MSEELGTADFDALHREIEQRFLETEVARDKALADVERLREALQKVANQAFREGCTSAGCDTQTTGHTLCCPVGVAEAIEAALKETKP